jgi:hypothetical protein
VLGDARESGDRGGDEREPDTRAEDEQSEEDVTEVAAAGGDLREEQRPPPISAIPSAATGRKPTRRTIPCPRIEPAAAMAGKTIEVSPNLTAE